MIVHRSVNVIVEQLRRIDQNRFLDFGFGFYTTANYIRAINSAEKVMDRRKTGNPLVNNYRLDERIAFEQCDLPKFDGANAVWLGYDLLLGARSLLYGHIREERGNSVQPITYSLEGMGLVTVR